MMLSEPQVSHEHEGNETDKALCIKKGLRNYAHVCISIKGMLYKNDPTSYQTGTIKG